MAVSEVVTAIEGLVLPQLKEIRAEPSEIKTALGLINKRLDDVNLRPAGQSRRIDAVRKELAERLDAVRETLTARFDAARERLGTQIETAREELTGRVDRVNDRLDRLYEVVVRRNEREALRICVYRLEVEVAELKQRLAA